jgi:hypothetical protein
MMTTGRLLQAENQSADTSGLVAKLVRIQRNVLTVDEAFLQQHAAAFAGREYAKYLELQALIATGEALRKQLSSADNSSSARMQKIEVDGFHVHLNNKIKEYKADCDARVKEVTRATISHHKLFLQRTRELRTHKQIDIALIPNLALAYDDLIAAYNSDLENMQEQSEQFHNAMDADDSGLRVNLRDLLVRLFYINRFEKSFLADRDEKYQKQESTLIEIYKKNLNDSIAKFHANLAKKQVIHANFAGCFDKNSFVHLTAMLKVMQDVLRNVMRDTRESLDGLREKLHTIKKLENDITVYSLKFYKAERLRRLNSPAYHKLSAMSETIETEIAKSEKQNDRLAILQAIQKPLKYLMAFYIDGRTYKGLTTDHIPTQLDARFEEQAIDDTLKALTECLQENQFKDVNLINWASQFLRKVHAVKPKSQDAASSSSSSPIRVDENEPAFSFAKELKEKELDVLIGQLANSLYPAAASQSRYSFLSMLSAKQPSVDANQLLVKMQYCIADKSEANLQTIIALASQQAMPAHLYDDLQNIARTAREIIDTVRPPALQNQGGLPQSML